MLKLTDSPNYSTLANYDSMEDEQKQINMRIKHHIEQPQIMFWHYNQPGIILGCSQQLNEVQIKLAEQYKLPWLRRKSGGGAVLVGPWMLSVTIFIPYDHYIAKGSITKIFSWLEQNWLKVLNENNINCAGVDKTMIDQSKYSAKKNQLEWACYGSLSHGEIVCSQGHKLVGLAQIRKAGGVTLVSGLNLSPFDWQPLSEIVNNTKKNAAVLANNNNYCSQLTSLPIKQLIPKIIKSFIEILPPDFSTVTLLN